MPIQVTRVPTLDVPEPERVQGAITGPAGTETPTIPLGIARPRQRIRSARLYLTTIATGAPGGPIAINAGNPTIADLRSDGAILGTVTNDVAAIANGDAITLAVSEIEEGEHLELYIDNTPAGAENWSTLRVTCVLELDPR